MSKETFLRIFKDLKWSGSKVSPRGLEIIELQNYSYEVEPYVRFMSFKSRKLSISYLKREFLWYLKGDRYDGSITSHAKIWQSVMNSDGSFNSNYGQYFFGDQMQFDTVVETLKKDKDSRRASILLLSREHTQSDTKDVPCTYALNFRVRNNKLNMTVHMRSQDAIYGMGNDLPTFSFIHEMMYNSLLEFYPELEYGIYHHFVDSFHLYEKHYEMLDKILDNDEYIEVECPKISGPEEVKFLRKMDFASIPESYKFTKWLTTINHD
jgi:thymidylate synthase